MCAFIFVRIDNSKKCVVREMTGSNDALEDHAGAVRFKLHSLYFQVSRPNRTETIPTIRRKAKSLVASVEVGLKHITKLVSKGENAYL